jgi:hypothetical protein
LRPTFLQRSVQLSGDLGGSSPARAAVADQTTQRATEPAVDERRRPARVGDGSSRHDRRARKGKLPTSPKLQVIPTAYRTARRVLAERGRDERVADVGVVEPAAIVLNSPCLFERFLSRQR